MRTKAVDFKDVQGLLRFGYRMLTEASLFLLTVRDGEAARAWMRTAPVSNAEKRDVAPATALQVAFTREGLEKIGLGGDVLSGFSAEFRSGMAGEESRSRLLGDVGPSAPSNWEWGSPGRVPHLLVMVYAQPGCLDPWVKTIQGSGWKVAFDELACLSTTNLNGVEPFGFVDGVSQPEMDWERTRQPIGDQLTYSNTVSLGEILLGYPNEYGQYTGRPLLPDEGLLNQDLPSAEAGPNRRDLGLNGSYLVLRTLEQNVRAFWRFADTQARSSASRKGEETRSQETTRETLAETMVGRRRNGKPLVALSAEAIPGVDLSNNAENGFTFDMDADGTRCPFGAHIRRANPRNADLPAPAVHGISHLLHTLGLGPRDLHSDAKASTRFHRILRRGREYGTLLTPEEAIASDADAKPRGIHFICLVANIARQFEFVQSAWIMSSKFDAMSGESDPLLGNREPVAGCGRTDNFSRPRQDHLGDRLSGLPRFVTVKGGAYFFLPSLGAIRYLAALGSHNNVAASMLHPADHAGADVPVSNTPR